MRRNALVEGEQDERLVRVEVRVVEQGQEPIGKPAGSISNTGIVSITA